METPQAGALFEGTCNDTIVVHTREIAMGSVIRVGARRATIQRKSTKEEYLSRCPQAPDDLSGIDRYFFYAGVME